MLNRRVLRIKVMQNLFAYNQAKEANYLLAEDYVKTDLEPNLNLDIPEKKVDMLEKEKQALKIIRDWKASKKVNLDEIEDSRITNAIETATSNYESNIESDSKTIKQKMLIEVESIFKHYCKLLNLFIAFSDIFENSNFENNTVISHLKGNDELESATLKHNITWSNQSSLLKKIKNEILNDDAEFLSYQAISSPSEEDDKNILNHILKEIVFKNEDMLEYLQSEDIYWEENKNILKSMVKKTLKDAASGTLLKISPNWEDDKAFFNTLFNETIKNDDELSEMIVSHSKNWKKDRLALTDVIILKMGVAEMLNFPSIPVKVSINEYIEISKSYSTPKSKQFINGLLDKFSSVLQKEGRIKKSGRGLIDNK